MKQKKRPRKVYIYIKNGANETKTEILSTRIPRKRKKELRKILSRRKSSSNSGIVVDETWDVIREIASIK